MLPSWMLEYLEDVKRTRHHEEVRDEGDWLGLSMNSW